MRGIALICNSYISGFHINDLIYLFCKLFVNYICGVEHARHSELLFVQIRFVECILSSELLFSEFFCRSYVHIRKLAHIFRDVELSY